MKIRRRCCNSSWRQRAIAAREAVAAAADQGSDRDQAGRGAEQTGPEAGLGPVGAAVRTAAEAFGKLEKPQGAAEEAVSEEQAVEAEQVQGVEDRDLAVEVAEGEREPGQAVDGAPVVTGVPVVAAQAPAVEAAAEEREVVATAVEAVV